METGEPQVGGGTMGAVFRARREAAGPVSGKEPYLEVAPPGAGSHQEDGHGT